MHAKRWTVTISIDEVDDDRTRAHAVLETGGSSHVTGEGFARRNPTDRPVPEIGDELAASRALSDLSLIHISEPTRQLMSSRMPSSA